jgi:hypothetical protein
VKSVVTSPGTGDLGVGAVVALTVKFSSAVTVSGGTPTLALNDGGSATYVSGSGTRSLVFDYTVAAGQNTADLALAASNAVDLNGATITNAAGTAAVLTAANGYNPSGTLQIDTTTTPDPTATPNPTPTSTPFRYHHGGGTVSATGNFLASSDPPLASAGSTDSSHIAFIGGRSESGQGTVTGSDSGKDANIFGTNSGRLTTADFSFAKSHTMNIDNTHRSFLFGASEAAEATTVALSTNTNHSECVRDMTNTAWRDFKSA